MPTTFGVYPAEDALTEGEQISSTYEGRHITLDVSDVTSAAGIGQCTKGLPIVCGHIVGIAFETKTTGQVAIDTEGIWVVDVDANDDIGVSAVAGGDPLYIHTGTCVVSKRTNEATHIPFGYALGDFAAGIMRIAVKLHWDPPTPEVFDIGGALSVGGSLSALEHFSVAYDATIGRDLSVLQHFSVAYNAIVGNDLTVNGHGNVANNLIVGNDLTVTGHLGALRAHIGNGATFTGAITNLTVEDGIVTAAS